MEQQVINRWWCIMGGSPWGLRKAEARIDKWRWDLAPTAALRSWFNHDSRKWEAFKRRYRNELKARGKMDELRKLAERAKRETITLLSRRGIWSMTMPWSSKSFWTDYWGDFFSISFSPADLLRNLAAEQ